MAKHRNRHRRPTPSRRRQVMALGVTGAVSAGVVVGAAGPAAADSDRIVSQSRGFFLSGELLGKDLADLVELEDAMAVNYGDRKSVSELNPLGVKLLNSLDIPLGDGINLLEGNGIIELGAVNQAAIARSDGSAVGASGAVTNSGAIAVGGKSNVPASNATIDLGNLLNTGDLTGLLGGTGVGAGGILENLVDLELEVGALSASANQAKHSQKGKAGAQTGDYKIADLKLDLQLPALGGILGDLDLLDALGDQTDTLGLGNLPLLQVLDAGNVVDTLSLNQLAAAGAGAGLLPTAGLTGLPDAGDLTALVGGIGEVENEAAGVSADLQSGKVTVDLAKLLKNAGIDINNLPPNTDLLKLILQNLDEVLLGLVQGAVDDLVGDILDGVGLNVLNTGGLTDTSLLSALDLPELEGLLGLGDGLLAPILGVGGGTPTGSLGVVPELDSVLGNDVTGLLDPILEDLAVLDLVTNTVLAPVAEILSDLISLKVNVQSRGGGKFTQRALQVGVLPATDLLELNLASASVGPGEGPAKEKPKPEKDDEEEKDEDESDVPPLPRTGGNGDATAQLGAAGLALVLAGGAALAGSRVGVPAAASVGTGRGRGRHARR